MLQLCQQLLVAAQGKVGAASEHKVRDLTGNTSGGLSAISVEALREAVERLQVSDSGDEQRAK
jgi:hypothetical protein